jgi:predicted short-subunit dehydrogenase-like oxidoreductase (DUF2520 family)
MASCQLPSLSIIGCGNLGSSLGRLWHEQQVFAIGDILNRSIESARDAVAFIGAGRVAESMAELGKADVFLVAVPDDYVAICCRQLAATGLLSDASLVFHCSGSLASSTLEPARALGAAVASVHPIRSFALPAQAVASFAGTWCGIEGDARALQTLTPAFTAIGGQLAPVNAEYKMLYHSAAVFASNYLVTLLDVALQAYAKAGIPHEMALKMIEPLVRSTADNVFRHGTRSALSGPIARGDRKTAIRQYVAIRSWDRHAAMLYRQLGRATAKLTTHGAAVGEIEPDSA